MKLPKSIGGWISLAFKVAGGAVAMSPVITAVIVNAKGGTPENIPQDILYNYTGFKAGQNLNFQQTAVGVGTIFGGLFLAKAGTWIGKAFGGR